MPLPDNEIVRRIEITSRLRSLAQNDDFGIGPVEFLRRILRSLGRLDDCQRFGISISTVLLSTVAVVTSFIVKPFLPRLNRWGIFIQNEISLRWLSLEKAALL